MYLKKKNYRNKRILEAARGEACTMGYPEVCCGDPATTVFAHSRYIEDGHGISIKAHDCLGAFMCRTCHDEFDGRTTVLEGWTKDQHRDLFHRAMKRTWLRLLEKGVLR